MVENVKVALWGFGAMGSGIARALLSKKGVDIIGVCDNHPQRVNQDMYELLEMDPAGRPPVRLKNNIEEVITPGAADICVIATDSFLSKVFDKVRYVAEQGINVISLAEEMSYPQGAHPEIAAELDRIARENSVSVMGTGINPGLVMDLLAVCLSGAMINVEKVVCRRVNSLSPFGKAVMEEQGVGLAPEEFAELKKTGALAGHVGFAESVTMISDGIGLGVDGFEQQMEPIIAAVKRRAPYGQANPGHVAGVEMTGQGYRAGEIVIAMEHPQQIEPEAEGISTGDYIELIGEPAIKMAIQPEISGGSGTIAMCVNSIPHVINGRPGLLSMLDIPVPRAIMGDYRDRIDPEKKLVK